MTPSDLEWPLQLRGGFGGALRGAPARRAGAVAPAVRAIEGVHADAGELAHGAHPARVHPVCMVVRRLADLGQPDAAVEGLLGDARGALVVLRLGDPVRDAVAREGELAGQMPMGVLIDDAARR